VKVMSAWPHVWFGAQRWVGFSHLALSIAPRGSLLVFSMFLISLSLSGPKCSGMNCRTSGNSLVFILVSAARASVNWMRCWSSFIHLAASSESSSNRMPPLFSRLVLMALCVFSTPMVAIISLAFLASPMLSISTRICVPGFVASTNICRSLYYYNVRGIRGMRINSSAGADSTCSAH
jgi:hypothetical protein